MKDTATITVAHAVVLMEFKSPPRTRIGAACNCDARSGGTLDTDAPIASALLYDSVAHGELEVVDQPGFP